jgi:xanthine/uracil permease
MPSPQTQTAKPTAPDQATPTDPGFKLPGQAQTTPNEGLPKTTPNEGLPKTTPDTATQPTEIAPGGMTNTSAAPLRDASTRDLMIGSAVFLVLIVIYFFARNAYVHHLVVRRVAPSSAGSAGWLLFVGLCFVSAAAELAIINTQRYLTPMVTGPLILVGVLALIAAVMVGRR